MADDRIDLEKLQDTEGEILIEPDENVLSTEEKAEKEQETVNRGPIPKRKPGQELIMNASRYTWKEWQRAYPDRDENRYYRAESPNALNLYVSSILMQLLRIKKEDRPDRIRVVTLDEEYEKWQEENKKENTPDSRAEYCTTIDDKNALRLLQKNHMDYSIEFLTIPLALLGTKHAEQDLYLRKSVAEEITKYLEPFYGEGNVYVPRYILSLEAGIGLQNDVEKLLKAADAWFTDGTKNAVPELKTQRLARNRSICCIPIAIRITHKSADFPVSHVPKEEAQEFNPILLLGDKRKTAAMPFMADLANIDGFGVSPAPEMMSIQLLYQQMAKLTRQRTSRAAQAARQDIREAREEMRKKD